AVSGVHPLRPGLRMVGVAGHPRQPPDRPGPDADVLRDPAGEPDRRNRHHRARLLLGRHRAVDRRVHAERRPPGDPGDRALLRIDHCSGLPRHGRRFRPTRPPHPTRTRRCPVTSSRRSKTTLATARRLARIRLWGSLIVIGFLILYPYVFSGTLEPFTTDASRVLAPPDAQNWFGTDRVGADILSRTLWAGRTDLPLALAGTFLAVLVGAPLGAWFGYSSKLGERMIRLIDAFQALPLLILILALVALSGRKAYMIVVAIVLYAAPSFIRVVRSEVLAV